MSTLNVGMLKISKSIGTKTKTRKIVYNGSFGGFGLSEKAVLKYAELKGFKVYPKKGKFGLIIYYLVPEEERYPFDKYEKVWYQLTDKKKEDYKAAWDQQVFEPDDIERDDEVLVQVVEMLGREANGNYANLRVVKIPSDIDWTITEYDGNETVEEVHRSWR